LPLKPVAAMLAVDTNVIVRFLTGDDPVQAARAKTLINAHPVFVSTTVLLETEWVLRSAYDFSAKQVGAALTDFAGLPRVTLEDPALAAQALAWMADGMDFADALHVARAATCDAFVTFDEKCLKRVRALGTVKGRQP
jgi:predicted nucleic-acid-binding protein